MRFKRQVYSSALVRIGTLRCSVDDSAWSLPVQARLWPGVSFPLLPVRIHFEGTAPFVADPNTPILLDTRRPFTRSKLHEQGTHAVFFSWAPDVVADSVRRYEPAVDSTEKLFHQPSGSAGSDAHLRQRLIFEHVVVHGQDMDSMRVEEASIRLIDRVVSDTYESRNIAPARCKPSTAAWRAEVSEAVKEILGLRYAEPHTLRSLAREVHSSPYHLSRIFLRHTGISIHRYLNRLRLRAAIEGSRNVESKLAKVAIDVGFARHSHLTQAFRKEFGCAPSEIRSCLRRGALPTWMRDGANPELPHC